MKFLLAHGPNLNLLGTRDPAVYGTATLADIEQAASDEAALFGITVETFQTNHEGAMLDRLHASRGEVDGIIINPGAWTHTSYALRDAIEAIEIPTLEIHLSNVKEREAFRRHSVIEDVAAYTIYGRGDEGYPYAVRRLYSQISHPPTVHRYGSHPDQLAELRLPTGDGPFPVVALVHGGFWRHTWTRDTLDLLALDLVANGFAAWNVEYRRTGMGGGGDATMSDVASAIDALTEVDAPLDLDRVAVAGHSAGGQLALWAASPGACSQPLRLVVSLAGVTDLVSGRDEDLGAGAVNAFMGAADLSPSSPQHLLPLGTPSLCVHGTADEAVPFHFSERFIEAAVAAGDDAALLADDGDHFDVIDPRSGVWAATRARLADALNA